MRIANSYGKPVFWFCLLGGLVCLAVAAITFVAARNLFNAQVFGSRAARSLSDSGVSAYAADQIATAIIRSRPDLITVRPLIVATAAGIVPTDAFRALVQRAAKEAHQAAFSEASQRIVLSIPDFEVLVREALGQASPEIAAKIPKRLNSALTSLGNSRGTQYLVDLSRMGRRLQWIWKVLFPAGLLLLAAAVWVAPHRRRALVQIGGGFVITGLIVTAIVPAAVLAAGAMQNGLERGAARGLLRAFFGDIREWGLFYTGLGLLCWAGAASLLERLDPVREVARYSRHLVTPPISPGNRLLWSAGLLAGGTLIVVFPFAALEAVIMLAGVFTAYLGIRELFRLFLERLAPHPFEEASAGGRSGTYAAISIGVLVILLGGAWAVWRNPAVKPLEPSDMACNGSAQLCDKRLDEVVFAGSHNSMSNQEIPGWMFPHHEANIPHQLRDGIRALLFDVHYGFPGGARVKTDTETEPMMDKVKEAVGEEGFQAALRIRNRLVGVDEKKRGIYLCHGLCELGAYELEPTLREIRDFLVTHPDEVLLIIVEDYVNPQELAAAFEQARLGELIYKGDPTPHWPTLRELINAGQRLVLFIESGKPGVPWLRPAFQNFRETPYSFHKVEDFSCRANRGGDGGSLFLMNNWVETTPTPKPSNAAIVNGYSFLLARARKCEKERQHIPNIIAVDFYRTGDLLRVVDELNGVQPPEAGRS